MISQESFSKAWVKAIDFCEHIRPEEPEYVRKDFTKEEKKHISEFIARFSKTCPNDETVKRMIQAWSDKKVSPISDQNFDIGKKLTEQYIEKFIVSDKKMGEFEKKYKERILEQLRKIEKKDVETKQYIDNNSLYKVRTDTGNMKHILHNRLIFELEEHLQDLINRHELNEKLHFIEEQALRRNKMFWENLLKRVENFQKTSIKKTSVKRKINKKIIMT